MLRSKVQKRCFFLLLCSSQHSALRRATPATAHKIIVGAPGTLAGCRHAATPLAHIPHYSYSIAVVWTLVFLVFPSLERRAQRQRAVPRVWVCCPAAGSHVAGCFGGADGPPDPGLTAVAGEASRARKRGVRAQRKDVRSGVRLRSSPIYFAAQTSRGPRW